MVKRDMFKYLGLEEVEESKIVLNTDSISSGMQLADCLNFTAMVGPKVVLCYKSYPTNLGIFQCLEEEAARKKYWNGDYPMECYERATPTAMNDLKSCIIPPRHFEGQTEDAKLIPCLIDKQTSRYDSGGNGKYRMNSMQQNDLACIITDIHCTCCCRDKEWQVDGLRGAL